MIEKLSGEDLRMSEISQYLNGVARIITYTLDGGKKSIKSIMEGEMVEGLFNGFARKLYISQENKKDLLNTNCQVGYWKNLKYKDPKVAD